MLFATILYRFAAYELPDVFIEAAKFFAHLRNDFAFWIVA